MNSEYPTPKKDGWTWAKEILGTTVGVLTIAILPGAWMFSALVSMQRDADVHEIRIRKLEEAQAEDRRSHERVQEQLNKIYDIVQEVRIQQAKQVARDSERHP